MMSFLRDAIQFNPMQAGSYGIFGMLLFILLLAWSFTWKGMALWRAARRSHKKWFVVLLIVNSLGILEILYLFVFSKRIGKAATDTNSKGL